MNIYLDRWLKMSGKGLLASVAIKIVKKRNILYITRRGISGK